jgi:hypothetical protein
VRKEYNQEAADCLHSLQQGHEAKAALVALPHTGADPRAMVIELPHAPPTPKAVFRPHSLSAVANLAEVVRAPIFHQYPILGLADVNTELLIASIKAWVSASCEQQVSVGNLQEGEPTDGCCPLT